MMDKGCDVGHLNSSLPDVSTKFYLDAEKIYVFVVIFFIELENFTDCQDQTCQVTR